VEKYLGLSGKLVSVEKNTGCEKKKLSRYPTKLPKICRGKIEEP
jgi:hypothetical protein